MRKCKEFEATSSVRRGGQVCLGQLSKKNLLFRRNRIHEQKMCQCLQSMKKQFHIHNIAWTRHDVYKIVHRVCFSGRHAHCTCPPMGIHIYVHAWMCCPCFQLLQTAQTWFLPVHFDMHTPYFQDASGKSTWQDVSGTVLTCDRNTQIMIKQRCLY